MKYSVKLILYTHQANAKGQYPIYIRITINRKQSYLSTGHFIDKKFWDERSEQVKTGHLLSGSINPEITSRKQSIIKVIVDHQVKGLQITPAALKAMISTGGDLHNLFDFVESFAKEVRHKREAATLENYRKHMLVLELYHGSRTLAFEEITHTYLIKFEDHLRNPVEGGRDALGGNYIHAIWRTLKTFFNAAKKRGIIKCYPFDTYENPTYEATRKAYLTIKELDELEKKIDTANDLNKQTIIYFLLGCYTGLRSSDWYQFDADKHVRDGRLFLRAKKNGEWVTMPVVGRLARHMERVRDCKLTRAAEEMNKALKKLIPGKRISTHCGRKTFAITMCAEKGISLEVCAALMGITVSVCEKSYYSVTQKKIEDEILNKWK